MMEDFIICFIAMALTGALYHTIPRPNARVLYCAAMAAALTCFHVSFRWIMLTMVYLLFEEMRRETRPVHKKRKAALLLAGAFITVLSYVCSGYMGTVL